MPQFDEQTLIYLRALRDRFPTAEAALAAIAGLRAALTLPKGTTHVISDVHGEYVKLAHVLRNASGSLRPLVEQTFGTRLTDAEKRELLNMIYYPRETFMEQCFAGDHERQEFIRRICTWQFELLRVLSRRYDMATIEQVFPASFRAVFRELLFGKYLDRSQAFIDALLAPIREHRGELDFLRHISRVVRSLLVSELIVAGD
ncbi:MAG TPA: fructose-bisphosphatase class III, partial [Chthoniobacteraceae bacterium]|nr:fructose-bisphosphatase class III [Chthoniobacteraceae bacterium]